jgi:hypothetical protein
MLRSNLIGTFVAATTLGGAAQGAEPSWTDLTPPSVTLIEAGTEPRRPLRYDPPNTDRQYVRRVQSYEVSARLPMGAGREDAGQITMLFDTRAVPPSGDAPIELYAELRQVLGANTSGDDVVGSGLVRFDAQGRALQARWDQAPPSGSAEAVLLERFHSRVAELPTPLPEEPVGLGGRWTVRQTLQQGSGTFALVAECKLVGETDAGLDIECRFRHETDLSTFTLGKGKRAREVQLDESSVDGTSLVLQSLRSLAPLREDGDLRTYFEARTKMGLFTVKAKIDTAERWNQVGAEAPFPASP